MKKSEGRWRDLQDAIKVAYIKTTGAPKREESDKQEENLFKEMSKKQPKLERKETSRSRKPRKFQKKRAEVNPKRSTLRHYIKLPKAEDKKRLLKVNREDKLVSYNGTPKRLSEDFFLAETLWAKRKWNDKFKTLREKKKGQPRKLYPVKVSFRTERKIKHFPDKQTKAEGVLHHYTGPIRKV